MNESELVKRLEEIRGLTGLSREDFSVKLGLSKSMYGKVVTGKNPPGAKFHRAVLKSYPKLRKLVVENLTGAVK
jgi:transcriptional regulator with XRE-family HTH domain